MSIFLFSLIIIFDIGRTIELLSELSTFAHTKLTIVVNAPLIVEPCQLRGMPCLESSIPDTLK